MIALAPSPLGAEALDRTNCPVDVARATLADIAVANRLFGGRSAAWFGLRQLLPTNRPGPWTVLDAGAGMGDVTRFVKRRAARRGIELRAVALDRLGIAARLARASGLRSVVADAGALPIADRSVDVVLACQFLHHFDRASAAALIRRFTKVARLGVVIADLRRSRIAAAGIWCAALALGFHPVSRRDGVLSIKRGFTTDELTALLRSVGVAAVVHRRPGFRVVAAIPTDAHG